MQLSRFSGWTRTAKYKTILFVLIGWNHNRQVADPCCHQHHSHHNPRATQPRTAKHFPTSHFASLFPFHQPRRPPGQTRQHPRSCSLHHRLLRHPISQCHLQNPRNSQPTALLLLQLDHCPQRDRSSVHLHVCFVQLFAQFPALLVVEEILETATPFDVSNDRVEWTVTEWYGADFCGEHHPSEWKANTRNVAKDCGSSAIGLVCGSSSVWNRRRGGQHQSCLNLLRLAGFSQEVATQVWWFVNHVIYAFIH